MSQDTIFEHPLGELPNDDILRIVLSVGEAGYEGSSVEPVWTCILYPLVKRRVNLQNPVILKVGAGLFRRLPINSVWRGQDHVGFIDGKWPSILHCDFDTQDVLYRKVDNILGVPKFSYLQAIRMVFV